MARKITIVTGSPRDGGNTATLAGWIAEAATQAGAEVRMVNAARLDYRVNGCVACMGCQIQDEFECVIRDEAQPILKSLPEADVLVFATPIYFFGPSAQFKMFLDRAYSLFKFKFQENRIEHRLHGKTLALVASGGGDIGSGLALVEQTFKAMSGFTGMAFKSLLVPNAPHGQGELAKDPAMKAKAEAFGKALVQ